MSWNAYLVDDRGHIEGAWGYTHNTNGMANVALDESGYERPLSTRECWVARVNPDDEVLRDETGRAVLVHCPNGHGLLSWWKCLNGLSGPDGAALLDRIVRGIEADLPRFEAMSPENGWGTCDRFVGVLREMRDCVPEWPCVWETSG